MNAFVGSQEILQLFNTWHGKILCKYWGNSVFFYYLYYLILMKFPMRTVTIILGFPQGDLSSFLSPIFSVNLVLMTELTPLYYCFSYQIFITTLICCQLVFQSFLHIILVMDDSLTFTRIFFISPHSVFHL